MRARLAFLLMLLGVAGAASAQAPIEQRSIPLTGRFDLDGAANSTTNIVATVNLTNTTLTIAAQPDTGRLLRITVVDTTPSITVGNVTITGQTCEGVNTSEVVAFTGAATKDTTNCWESVTSIVTTAFAALGGAGDETIAVGGHTRNAEYCVTTGVTGRVADDRGRIETTKVTTSGSTTTALAAVTAGTNPFANLAVGDWIYLNVDGVQQARTIVTRTDADNVVLDATVNVAAAGLGFEWRKQVCLGGASTGWIPMAGYTNTTFHLVVAQMNGTGGIDYAIECKPSWAGWPTPVTVVSANISAVGSRADNITAAYDLCRISLKWATNDDAVDTTTNQEQIYAAVVQRR